MACRAAWQIVGWHALQRDRRLAACRQRSAIFSVAADSGVLSGRRRKEKTSVTDPQSSRWPLLPGVSAIRSKDESHAALPAHSKPAVTLQCMPSGHLPRRPAGHPTAAECDGLHQVGFSAAIRRARARTSAVVLGRPARRRDFQRQYRLNPSRCQRMTVSGWTMASVSFHRGQQRRRVSQKNRSDARRRGRGCFRRRTASCCRSARFSRIRSARLAKIARRARATARARLSIPGR